MQIKNQLKKIKDNWLIVVLIGVLFLFIVGKSFTGYSPGVFTQYTKSAISTSYDRQEAVSGGSAPIPSKSDFAPEIQDRKITKTASMQNEVKRGTFKEEESKVKNIIQSSSSYLLTQNVNLYGTGKKAYYEGYYQIKVDASKYDSIIEQLKGIGEVTSFNENAQDITGSYQNAQIEIEAEKARLTRYQTLFDQAEKVDDKISLTDRIFEEERSIKYMEESLKTMDQRVSYSTVYLTLNEKQSDYINVVFVKFSEIIGLLMNSTNALIMFLFGILPWSIAIILLILGIRWFKKKR